MPRKRNPVPTYRLHKQSGQAVVTVRNPDGGRRDILLGRYDSPESKAEYERILAELRVAPQAAAAPPSRRAVGVTVNEVLLAFLTHADDYYRRPDGTPTSEPRNYRDALRPVRELYGHTPAAEFGPLALKAVREAMVGRGWCRSLVNQATGRVRRVFKWAAGEELIPFEAYHRLTAVRGLARGRSAARESEPVGPVPLPAVLATLPHLNRHLAAMVRLQLLAGMRPGEVCRFRLADVDRAVEVWTYTPPQHKTLHRGKTRRVKVGPQAQAVLAPFLGGDPAVPLFSPRQARAERFAAMRAARKSRVQPSQADRSKAAPKKLPGLGYTVGGYSQAVAKAAGRANARRERLSGGGEFDPVPHWHPNQLRHTAATDVRKRFGLEAAQVLLGHSKADVTQVYAERDEALAERVAAAVG